MQCYNLKLGERKTQILNLGLYTQVQKKKRTNTNELEVIGPSCISGQGQLAPLGPCDLDSLQFPRLPTRCTSWEKDPGPALNQAGLTVTILLLHPPECWDDSPGLPSALRAPREGVNCGHTISYGTPSGP